MFFEGGGCGSEGFEDEPAAGAEAAGAVEAAEAAAARREAKADLSTSLSLRKSDAFSFSFFNEFLIWAP